jgi:transposase
LNKDVIIALLQNRLQEQERLIKQLLARIEELENNQKKDSRNSSKPPSSDIGKIKRTQSLRKSSRKKPGGQQGHEGSHLEMRADPDRVERHQVSACMCCGKGLAKVGASSYEARQVHDIPPVRMIVTEHRSEIKTCPGCGTINQGVFPEGVSQRVQYGPEVQKPAVYFTNYQLLPIKRTAEMFEDLFGHRVSEGWLVNMNQRCAGRLSPFMEGLKEVLRHQAVLYGDETGYYYKGTRNWLHTLATENHTFYMAHPTRGREAMDAMGILGSYEGTLVH